MVGYEGGMGGYEGAWWVMRGDMGGYEGRHGGL